MATERPTMGLPLDFPPDLALEIMRRMQSAELMHVANAKLDLLEVRINKLDLSQEQELLNLRDAIFNSLDAASILFTRREPNLFSFYQRYLHFFVNLPLNLFPLNQINLADWEENFRQLDSLPNIPFELSAWIIMGIAKIALLKKEESAFQDAVNQLKQLSFNLEKNFFVSLINTLAKLLKAQDLYKKTIPSALPPLSQVDLDNNPTIVLSREQAEVYKKELFNLVSSIEIVSSVKAIKYLRYLAPYLSQEEIKALLDPYLNFDLNDINNFTAANLQEMIIILMPYLPASYKRPWLTKLFLSNAGDNYDITIFKLGLINMGFPYLDIDARSEIFNRLNKVFNECADEDRRAIYFQAIVNMLSKQVPFSSDVIENLCAYAETHPDKAQLLAKLCPYLREKEDIERVRRVLNLWVENQQLIAAAKLLIPMMLFHAKDKDVEDFLFLLFNSNSKVSDNLVSSVQAFAHMITLENYQCIYQAVSTIQAGSYTIGIRLNIFSIWGSICAYLNEEESRVLLQHLLPIITSPNLVLIKDLQQSRQPLFLYINLLSKFPHLADVTILLNLFNNSGFWREGFGSKLSAEVYQLLEVDEIDAILSYLGDFRTWREEGDLFKLLEKLFDLASADIKNQIFENVLELIQSVFSQHSSQAPQYIHFIAHILPTLNDEQRTELLTEICAVRRGPRVNEGTITKLLCTVFPALKVVEDRERACALLTDWLPQLSPEVRRINCVRVPVGVEVLDAELAPCIEVLPACMRDYIAMTNLSTNRNALHGQRANQLDTSPSSADDETTDNKLKPAK